MSRRQMLRELVTQRLTSAGESIFEMFEGTIAEYEEEITRSKEENELIRKKLGAVMNPEVRLHRAEVQQLLMEQEWSSSMKHEDPQSPHIKQELEELWNCQEREQHEDLQDADVSKFPSTPVPVKSENDEEEAQSSQLRRSHTVENREAAGSSIEQM